MEWLLESEAVFLLLNRCLQLKSTVYIVYIKILMLMYKQQLRLHYRVHIYHYQSQHEHIYTYTAGKYWKKILRAIWKKCETMKMCFCNYYLKDQQRLMSLGLWGFLMFSKINLLLKIYYCFDLKHHTRVKWLLLRSAKMSLTHEQDGFLRSWKHIHAQWVRRSKEMCES